MNASQAVTVLKMPAPLTRVRTGQGAREVAPALPQDLRVVARDLLIIAVGSFGLAWLGF